MAKAYNIRDNGIRLFSSAVIVSAQQGIEMKRKGAFRLDKPAILCSLKQNNRFVYCTMMVVNYLSDKSILIDILRFKSRFLRNCDMTLKTATDWREENDVRKRRNSFHILYHF